MGVEAPVSNIIDLPDMSVRLTRVYSAKYFRKVLNDGCLTLVKPEAWEDPFEDILLKCSVRTVTGRTISLKVLRGCLYAQSWSLLPESDAMWRIYSPNRLGIKVGTTASELFGAFYRSRNPDAARSYFIGRVRYFTEAELKSWLTRPDGAQQILLRESGGGLAKSLLVKRDPFSHEKEVRLIYRNPSRSRAERRRLHTVKIDPSAFFPRIVLDPRLDGWGLDTLVARIRSWGYEGLIEQSGLYASQHFLVKLKSSWDIEEEVIGEA